MNSDMAKQITEGIAKNRARRKRDQDYAVLLMQRRFEVTMPAWTQAVVSNA